ncbi:MAG: peptidylprolyl isomerase [Clostridia bacterium]|nr:peptidylprolyl isomerase [Clostridia bacterium]MBQ9995299.1 peptidylprolyl isomerase [Clostridia bacterium]
MNNEAKVLATVGGKPITEMDVEMMLMQMGQRASAYNNPQGRAMILDQLINSKLFLMDAQKNLYEREPAFKEQFTKVKEEMLSRYAVQKAVERVRVTDEEAKKYFEENPEQFAPQATFNASHILVETEEQAAEIAEQIKSGELTFEDAAMQFSSCPSKQNGGSLGEFGHGQMVPEFEAACEALEEGELSAPVQTQFGWHLIKLVSKGMGKPVEYKDVAEQLKEALMGEKQNAAYQSKINQLKLLFPVDKF